MATADVGGGSARSPNVTPSSFCSMGEQPSSPPLSFWPVPRLPSHAEPPGSPWLAKSRSSASLKNSLRCVVDPPARCRRTLSAPARDAICVFPDASRSSQSGTSTCSCTLRPAPSSRRVAGCPREWPPYICGTSPSRTSRIHIENCALGDV